MDLKPRLALHFSLGLVLFGAVLFFPAGSLRFWQGWVYLGILFVPGLLAFLYFYKRDPQLLERRLPLKETVREQKLIMSFVYAIWLFAFVLAGLDHRWGWSHVPLRLTVASQVGVFAGSGMSLWAITVNRFAARTIRVEPGQPVVSTGPYHVVRHPMYLGVCVMLLFTPWALGSWSVLPAVVLLLALVVLRLLNEEKVLRQELPGYAEYCLRTRFRLVPFLW